MVTKTIICDVCGTQKKEANHWFRAVCPVYGMIKLIGPSIEYINDTGSLFDICGETCVHNFVSQWITGMRENANRNDSGSKAAVDGGPEPSDS